MTLEQESSSLFELKGRAVIQRRRRTTSRNSKGLRNFVKKEMWNSAMFRAQSVSRNGPRRCATINAGKRGSTSSNLRDSYVLCFGGNLNRSPGVAILEVMFAFLSRSSRFMPRHGSGHRQFSLLMRISAAELSGT